MATLGLFKIPLLPPVSLAAPGWAVPHNAANFGPKVGVGGERGAGVLGAPTSQLVGEVPLPAACPAGRLCAPYSPRPTPGPSGGTRLPRKGEHTLARKAQPGPAPRRGEECGKVCGGPGI